MSGKGDKWRKTNYKKFFNNFDEIDFKNNKNLKIIKLKNKIRIVYK